MATDYEKVCPACGTAAPLAAKFCAGCGHEYRTVFHEQSEPVVQAASAAPDMNWVPLLTVLPVLILLIILAFTRQPVSSTPPVVINQTIPGAASAPAAAPALPSQMSSNVPQASLLAYGQSTADVERLIGTPQRRESINNGGPEENWYYTQGGRTLQVHFNHQGQVDSYTTY